MNRITIKYFASIREALGQSSESFHTAATTAGQLRAELVARGGMYAHVLASGKAMRVAVNQTMAEESTALTDGTEVAFFPPVTGG